jgi:hypothetical protein
MLADLVPEASELEKMFGNNESTTLGESKNATSFGESAGGGSGSGQSRRSSFAVDNAMTLDRVVASKESANTLKQTARRCDALDDAFGKYCESGRMLTNEQRGLRSQFISNWVVKQSEVFIKFAPFLKSANTFISNYHNALETLEKFAGDELTLLGRLESDALLKNLKLRDFLIKPVQRVCKYPLLFREIIKYAQEDETKVMAVKAQSSLMTIADQVNTMMKLNESGNAKKLAVIRQNIRPQSDVEAYELTNALLRREGDLYVVSCFGSSHAPELKALAVVAKQLESKPKGSVRGLLFADQLLLVEVSIQFLTRAERIRIVHSFSVSQNWESIKVDKHEQDGFSLTLTHASDGPARGATIVWTFRTPPAARDGWVEDLMELSERLEKVRERVSLARQQEMKAEMKRRSGAQKPQDRTSGKMGAPAPAPPPRRGPAMKDGFQGIQALVNELRDVQSNRLEAAKQSIV